MVALFAIRSATALDADVLARHRRAMFEAMGLVATPDDGRALELASRRFLRRALADKTFLAWLAEDGGRVVAGGGLQLRDRLPQPDDLGDAPGAYILNVWTEPTHRRRGLAASILDAMVAWCRERGIRRLALHPSEDGRSLYERYGFRPTGELRLVLED